MFRWISFGPCHFELVVNNLDREKVGTLMALQTVVIQNLSFVPDPIVVSAGDEVVWENRDSMSHTATRTTDPMFDTGIITPGQTSGPIRFDAIGEYSYFCRPHPFMRGSVSVKKSGGLPPPPLC